jgi:phenylalanyl-tRNA synthetase beta chain
MVWTISTSLQAITITPSIESNRSNVYIKEKISNFLVGFGFNEILTNSITNSKYFNQKNLDVSVKMLNNLSNELNVLRSAILPTALEVIAFNHNRRNADLKLFEFGKTYNTSGVGNYTERNHLCIYITGNTQPTGWKQKQIKSDLFYLKGIAEGLFKLLGLHAAFSSEASSPFMETMITASIAGTRVLKLGKVAPKVAMEFDVKEEVFFANFDLDVLIKLAASIIIKYIEISKFLQLTATLHWYCQRR